MTTKIGHDGRDHATVGMSGHVTNSDMPNGHVSGGHVTSRPLVTCPGTADTDTATVSAPRDHVPVTGLTDTADTDTAEHMPMTDAVDGSGEPR